MHSLNGRLGHAVAVWGRHHRAAAACHCATSSGTRSPSYAPARTRNVRSSRSMTLDSLVFGASLAGGACAGGHTHRHPCARLRACAQRLCWLALAAAARPPAVRAAPWGAGKHMNQQLCESHVHATGVCARRGRMVWACSRAALCMFACHARLPHAPARPPPPMRSS
jgi:hypothetical protein